MVNNNAFDFCAPVGNAASAASAAAAGNKTDHNTREIFNKRPPNQNLYEKLTNDVNYSSWVFAFKRQATFDHFVYVLEKNNKEKLCHPDADI